MKTAIAVMAYNRPVYLKRCLEAIASSDSPHDVHIFIDSPAKLKQKAIPTDEVPGYLECRKLAQSILPKATFHCSAANIAPSPTSIAMKACLFDVYGYDRSIHLVDDFVPTKSFWPTMEMWFNYAQGDMRYGTLGCYSERRGEDHDNYLNNITTCGHLVSYGLEKEKWDVWKHLALEAAEIYWTNHRPSYYDKLTEWLAGIGFKDRFGTECDAILISLMIKFGQVPVSTVANLGEYVGVEGTFGNEEDFNRMFKGVPVDDFLPKFEKPQQRFFDVALSALRERYKFCDETEATVGG